MGLVLKEVEGGGKDSRNQGERDRKRERGKDSRGRDGGIVSG